MTERFYEDLESIKEELGWHNTANINWVIYLMWLSGFERSGACFSPLTVSALQGENVQFTGLPLGCLK